MTTAHRPTWKAAVGQANEGGWAAGGAASHQSSALDAPAHTKLKLRKSHQVVDKKQALQKSLLALEEAEASGRDSIIAKHIGKRRIDQAVEERGKQRLLKQTAEVDVDKIKKKYDDSDVDDGGGSSDSDLDANDDSDLDDSDSDDDEEDEEAALQAELAKIRAEREESKRKQEEKAAMEENAAAEEAAVLGNPLLNMNHDAASGGRMKRRWNDDVVFRNQAKSEPAPQKRFINDTIRNDFHKRFLNKFMK